MPNSSETSSSTGLYIGVGPTKELRLRVSVATLSRVLFESPYNGKPMLALERKATLIDQNDRQTVTVRAQPFGGAIRFRSLVELFNLIGNFNFDSERSQSERDFRILIDPSSWKRVIDFCLEHLKRENDPVLESDPHRELVEEFVDTLQVNIHTDQYTVRSVGFIVENAPSPTENIYLRDYPTVRIYHTYEVIVIDPLLINAMMKNSERYTDQDLQRMALEDAECGAKGRANAMLTLPIDDIRRYYLALPMESRDKPVAFMDYQLNGNVPAVLEGVDVPKFKIL